MSARERILARVADAQTVNRRAYADGQRRYEAPAPAPDLAQLFGERATRLGSEVLRVEDLLEVPAAVARYLATYRLAPRAVCWPELIALPWSRARLEVEARAARDDDAVGLTGAFCAVAETGTLMLLSGPQTPATVSLLPEIHIAVLGAANIVATMEAAWARVRARHGALPRAVNFVSGPSRTADVEQTVTLGAHGPRAVLIILVGN